LRSRYTADKYNDQQAVRDGDWKYLKILDNTFLFDVAQDPMERANLKERHRDVYERLVGEWNEWIAPMLPLDPQSFTGGFTGAEFADHFGVRRGSLEQISINWRCHCERSEAISTDRALCGRDCFAAARNDDWGE
jgi:hypothetical protein